MSPIERSEPPRPDRAVFEIPLRSGDPVAVGELPNGTLRTRSRARATSPRLPEGIRIDDFRCRKKKRVAQDAALGVRSHEV